MMAPLRPKVRYRRDALYVVKHFIDMLMILDPLSLSRTNVFDQTGRTFSLQDDGGNVVLTGCSINYS
jgi:hypothetical protein